MLVWKKTTVGKIPEGAVPCGSDYDTGEILYAARVYHVNGTHIGKVGNKDHKQAHIPWGGKELLFNEFEILTMELDDIKVK